MNNQDEDNQQPDKSGKSESAVNGTREGFGNGNDGVSARRRGF